MFNLIRSGCQLTRLEKKGPKVDEIGSKCDKKKDGLKRTKSIKAEALQIAANQIKQIRLTAPPCAQFLDNKS